MSKSLAASRVHELVRYDVVADGCLLIEVKSVQSVQEVHSIHKALLLLSMKLLNVPTGLIFNFHARRALHVAAGYGPWDRRLMEQKQKKGERLLAHQHPSPYWCMSACGVDQALANRI